MEKIGNLFKSNIIYKGRRKKEMKLAFSALTQNLASTDSILYATISAHEIDFAEIKTKQENTLSLLS